MPPQADRRALRTPTSPGRRSVPTRLPLLVFSVDTSGRILRLEGDVKRWTGRGPRAVIADPASLIPLIHADDRRRVLGFVRAAVGGSAPCQTEFRCRPPGCRTALRCRLHLEPAGRPASRPARLDGLIVQVPRDRAAPSRRPGEAEQALLENERRYRALAESSQDMIFILDRDCVIQYVNARAAALFGCSPDQLVGRSNHALFPAEIAARHQQLVRQVFETRRPILSENRQEFPGRTVWLSTQLTPLIDEHGRIDAVMGVTRDVTEHRLAVAALEAREEQYRTLVENVGLGVFRVAIHPAPHFVHANPACMAMFGYDDLAEMTRRPGEDFFQDPADNQRVLAEILATGRMRQCLLRCRRRDGSPFEASGTISVVRDDRGRPIYLDGVVEDVTERRRTERQLRILSTAVSQARQGISVADERHVLIYVNEAFAAMMGRRAEELIGLSLHELVPPEERPAMLEALSVLERTGRFSGSFTTRRNDGSAWIALVESTLLHDPDGRVTGSLATVADVTEPRRIEAERARLLRAVENAAEGIGIWDSRMRPVYANAALLRLAGQTVERPAARRWPELFSGENLPASMGLFSRQTPGPSWEGRLTLVRTDGTAVPVAVHCSRVAEDDGGFQVVAALRDMTREVACLDQIRRLTADAAKSLENERARISRELHDELGQLVTAVNMNLAWLRARAPDSVPGFSQRLAETGAIVNEMLEAIRRLSGSLRPPILDNLGLIEAIRSWGRDFCQRAGLKWRITTRPAEIEVSDPLATTVFRIVQEALTNVARHARASRCDVAVVVTGGWLEVTIRDDGRGAVPQDLAGLQSLGVAGMRERAGAVGGTLTVENLPGGGVCVAARLPWPHS